MFRRVFRPVICAVLLAGLLAGSGQAAPILPTSYDMPNGHGHPSGGWFNYWDKSYAGSDATTVDNAALSGGLGDLADGVIPTRNWVEVENDEGTGPYVGWININPTIVFHFAGDPLISEVVVHTDDSLGNGGVTPPTAVVINGTTYPVTLPDPETGAPFAISVTGLALTGDVSVQLMRNTAWVFISEVAFAGAANASADMPEPGTLALLAIGLAGLAAAGRMRQWTAGRP